MIGARISESVRRIPINLRELSLRLSATDTPKSWFRGSYSRIKTLRLSLCLAALLSYSAFSLGTDFTTASFINLWFGLASSGYIIIAFIYLLGFRMWYAPTTLFMIVSALINFAININGGPLGVGTATSVFTTATMLLWLYLLVVGVVAMRYDRGSKINEMLKQS